MKLHTIPAPDPANLWPFNVKQTRMVAAGDPMIHLTLLAVGRKRARFQMTITGNLFTGPVDLDLTDWLELDRPCVALKTYDDEPAITLILRRVEEQSVRLQVTANPRLQQKPRNECIT